ncbi:DUF829 domain-containing protein [Histoplasma capsulatum]|uniref:DUF829 domain-containing protein n=1 Tax=Ajellomyces capsulatus TaxID=5037 RepID=A0A8A1MJY8_AJECA|nr:predicted protein [Histoplasma mississippiense (nom. inval.)]EDN10102.1 predicted protein [Histoplasma mississippiense (nom. inval.)]QSS66209.1 DUF829 domain-containing protein [Histoplasma capsulatum]
MVPKGNTPLSFMEKLSFAVYLYRPPTSIPTPPTTDPELVLILGWMDARDAHLATYIKQYQTMYPSSPILLVKGRLASLVFPNIGLRDTAPAVAPIFAALTNDEHSGAPQLTPLRPRLLIHSLSGGGSCSLYHLYNNFLQRHGTNNIQPVSSVPRHVTIFDSSPGAWSYQFNVDLLTAAIKPGWQRILALPLAHMIAMTFWVLIRGFGLPDNQKTYATAHNDPEKNDEASRTYIYGSADKICPARFVELDSVEARKKGFSVQLEHFEGTGHVAHVRADPDRYWRIVKQAWDDATRV